MKSIMLSIQPHWVEKILNNQKIAELRKNVPKCDLPCKVYIYCTHGNMLYDLSRCDVVSLENKVKQGKTKRFVRASINSYNVIASSIPYLNGKVVAEFTLKETEVIEKNQIYNAYVMEKCCCLSAQQVSDYTKGNRFFVWHIEDLIVYDKQRSLGEFICRKKLKRPPQSWCYVEEVNNEKLC